MAHIDGPVGFMAFHAGLESGTLEIASGAAAASGASIYTVHQPDALRWHVPSAEVDPAGSDALRQWLGHVQRVIALHGYGRIGRPSDVLVGGANRLRTAEVAEALRAVGPELRILDDPDEMPAGLRGRHPANPVNRATGGGAQVELPVRARLHPEVAAAITAALAGVARHWATDLSTTH